LKTDTTIQNYQILKPRPHWRL